MEITPCDATLGAEVRGVDLSQSLSAADFAEIEAAWHDHAVLIFPDQGLSDEAHLDFTRRFGRLEQGLARFFGSLEPGSESEFYLPELVMDSILYDDARVRVYPGTDRWLGITYREDLARLGEAFEGER